MMEAQRPDCSLTIPSQTRFLKMVVGLSKHISTLAGFSLATANRISLAVDEAVTNVIKHSFAKSENEKLTVEYRIIPAGLRIRILFFGTPPEIGTELVDLQKMIKHKKKGGLGVEMMRRIMDEVHYGQLGRQNYCEMVKWRVKS